MYGMEEAENYVEEGIVGLAIAVTLAFTGMTLLGGTDIVGNAVVLQQGPDLIQLIIDLIQSEETGAFIRAVLELLAGFLPF